jgi:hypothetical protein
MPMEKSDDLYPGKAFWIVALTLIGVNALCVLIILAMNAFPHSWRELLCAVFAICW